ncbi:NHL repeat containing protein [Thioploca ingrica]|uniref:NHL repeat containing protein n=1 Tax=Thioploca ingrica TaxID=40754 RepID=A0A090ACG5_9GAMM|nr:NHL repeat containing protein [Thioploca ingrica]
MLKKISLSHRIHGYPFKIYLFNVLILFSSALLATTSKEPLVFDLTWGLKGSGASQFQEPASLAIDSLGYIYVTDSLNHRVQKFNSNGDFITQWGTFGSNQGQFNQPAGIAIGVNNRVYVVDSQNHRFQLFDSEGQFIQMWGMLGTGDIQFNQPIGVAIDKTGNIYVTDTQNHRVQKLDSEGHFLLQWGNPGSEAGQFQEPKGIAIDNNQECVYVIDFGNHRLQKFDYQGNFLNTWGKLGLEAGQFQYPQSVVVDNFGYVYVMDTDNHRIQKFDSDGQFLTQWGMSGVGEGQFSSARGIAINTAGIVYVADTENHRIQKWMQLPPTFQSQWGTTGTGEGQFNNPYGITIDDNQDVYVTDDNNHRLQKFTQSGLFLSQYGSWGSGNDKFKNPAGIAIDKAGSLYVADRRNHRIQQLNSDGNFIKNWGDQGQNPGKFDNPWDVAVDDGGNVYVVDWNNHRIQKFDNQSNFITTWGGFGSQPGQFNLPQSIAIDENNNIYVVDTNNKRIQKFDSDGNFLLQWGKTATPPLNSRDGEFNQPYGIGIDNQNHVYVTDYQDNRIQQFDSEGHFLTKWGMLGAQAGQFSVPADVAVDHSGNVYVADYNNNRIQVFGIHSNQAPVNHLPSQALSLDEDQTLVFATAHNNLISISDEDAGNQAIKVTLTTTQGALTLNGTAGLHFSEGDGTADISMSFTGNLLNINSVLNGMQLTLLPNYYGEVNIQIVTDDQGYTGADGVKSTTATLKIKINPVADTPQVTYAATSEGVQTTTGLTISRHPDDGEEVAYFKITTIKNGLLFQHDGTTPIQEGEFISATQGNEGLKFTPTATNNGQFQVQSALTNDDAGLGGEPATVIINIGTVNDPPILKSIGNQTVKLGDLLTFTVSATDPDIPPNQLKFSLTAAPADAFIDSATGQFTWKPSQAGLFTFTVVVTDDGVNPDKLSDSEEITVIVGNSPPVLKPIATQTIALGQSMTFIASATDAEDKILFFSLLENKPLGATINPTTGQFAWSPTQSGTFTTTVVVTDTGKLSGRQTVTLVVGNTPPQLAPIAKQLVHLGTTVTLQATATDAENNELRFSLTQAPVGAVVDPLTGLFTWTPTHNGIFNFILVVTDSSGLSDQQAITITVAEQPILAPIGNQTVFVNQLLTFTAHATHPNDTPLTFSLGNAPDGAVIDSATGVFMWIPKQQGVFNTTVIGTDVNQNSVSENLTITVTVALTQLSLELDSNLIFKGDTLTVTGSLYRFPSNNLELNNNPIQLSITSPDNQVVTLETLTQNHGQYLFDNLPPLTQAGQYVLQTQFQGTDKLNSSQAVVTTVLVRALAGYAMLIQGKSQDGSGLDAHNKTLNRIYRTLKLRGFTDENIEYFNHNPNQAGLNIAIDNIPTLSNLKTGLNDLQTKLNAQPAPFYLILVDHGGSEGVFYLNESHNEIITATDLDNWLTQLEQGLNTQALNQPRIIMIGACYSGSFLSTLAKKGRVIVTSTAAHEESHQGPKEPDEIRSGEFFMEALFAQLGRGHSLKTAFELATQSIETFTLIAQDAPFNRFYQDRAAQHPLLEDNADRQGSNVLFLGQDGEVARNIYLGLGRRYDATAPDNPADIVTVTPTLYLDSPATTAQLVVTVNNPERVQNQQVAVDIRPPSLTLQRAGIENKEPLEINGLSRISLTATADKHFVGDFNAVNEPGQYEVFYWVTDTETQQMSPLKRSLVYKRQAGNYPPRSFSLRSPEIGSQTSTTVIFDWDDTTDPEGDRVTYTFLLATDPDFNQIIYRRDELLHSLTYLNNHTPIDDDLNANPTGLRDGTQYYWQVEAIDPFGERTRSQVFSFKTNNTNAPPSILSFQLFNAVQFFSLETADLSFWQMDEGGNLIMDEGGNPIPVTQPPLIYQEQNDYLLLLPQGRRRLKITSPGLETQTMDLDTTTEQPQLVLPNAPEIKLDPAEESNSLKLKIKPVATPAKNPGQLQFAVTATDIQENQINVNLLVDRVMGQDGEVAVAFTTINGTALAGNDYQSASGTLNWADQDNRSQRINLTIYNDSEFERDETFSINLSNPTGEAMLGTNRLTVTIKDDDTPVSKNSAAGTLQFSNATTTLSEIDGSVSSIMINRSGGNKGTVSVQYLATDEGNATRGQDYLIENNTLSWNEGDTQSKPVAIKIVNDDQIEPLETIYLSLINPTGGATLGTPSQIILTIQDDDTITTTSTTPPESVASNSTKQPITTTPDPVPTETIENNSPSQTNSTANPETTAESTNFTSNPETTAKPTNSTSVPETTAEPTSSAQNVSAQPVTTSNAMSSLQFTQYVYEVNEGDGKLTTLLVSRSGDSTGEASVQYTISPASEAKATEDFSSGSGTLHWQTGDTTAKSVDLQLLEDNQIEPDEKIFIYLSDPNGAQLGQPNATTIIVADNDADALQFSQSTYYVNEAQGDLSNLIQVNREGNSVGLVSVQYLISSASTASLSQDYDIDNFEQLLKWDAEDKAPQGIPIQLKDDDQVEGSETIVLSLHNPTGAQLGAKNQAKIIITDNDKETPIEALQPGSLQFTSPLYSVVEGSQVVKICVERILGYQGEITVKYQVTNRSTAVENIDYVLLQKEPLRWLPGEIIPKCLSFNVNADDLDEAFELIDLQLTDVTGGAQLGHWAETQILLFDPQVNSLMTEKELPDLGQGIALAAENSGGGQSHFRGGVSLHKAYHNPLTLSTTQPVSISGQINIDPLHVGQTADIVIVARWIPSVGREEFFMQNSNGQIQSWDLNSAHLVAAQAQVTLSAIQEIDIYTGLLNVGQFQIFFGYRLEDNTLFFNGEQPISVTSYQ